MVRIDAAADLHRQRTQALLEWLLRNGRREKLCAEVAAMAAAPHALVEDVFQEVCLQASQTGGCRGQSAGELYNWLRTATLRRVTSQLRTGSERHELPVGWTVEERRPQATSAGADAEVLERERRHELSELVQTVLAELNERQRKVAVLHAYGVKGPEIARRLRVSRRQVQRLKEQMLAGARHALAVHAGSGCDHGDNVVRRLAFGLASSREHTEAELHMASCESCAAVYRRLELWHEKVAALLSVPAAAHADRDLVERALHKTADALAQVKQQLADAGSQAKQHAAASYTRAVEYTPMASIRPGAAATAIAGCLALGGGAATYCIDRGVDPIRSFADIVRPAQSEPREAPEHGSANQQLPDPPQLPTTPPQTSPPPPAPAPAPQPAAQPEPQPTPAPPPPPPPPEPTPPGVQFGEPATPAASASSSQPHTQAPAEPAPAPANGGTDLYGP